MMTAANFKVRFVRMVALGADKTIRRWTGKPLRTHAVPYERPG